MQGSVHAELFEVLRSFFPQPPFECFASPLNCYFPAFGSAFEDLDFHFGSVGDFMNLTVDEGICEANPPFSPGLMSLMVDRIEHNIARADKKKKSLSFCVVVPTAKNSSTRRPAAQQFALESFNRMVNGPTCRLHIVLEARKHGYIEGAQHMRPTRFKDSSYDTSVILIQSKAARNAATLDVDAFEKAVRSAFASKHTEELQSRRLKEG